jgi:hypothetical protein
MPVACLIPTATASRPQTLNGCCDPASKVSVPEPHDQPMPAATRGSGYCDGAREVWRLVACCHIPHTRYKRSQDQETDQVPRRTTHVAIFSVEGITDRRMCRCDHGRAIWARMGACPEADGKDIIRCLFRTMARVFKCDAALRQRCSNLVQAYPLPTIQRRSAPVKVTLQLIPGNGWRSPA